MPDLQSYFKRFFCKCLNYILLTFVFEGHSVGYIKVWLLSNYMLPDPPKVCMPLLRLKFPFLWKDKIDGRAKRAVRDQKLPVLLSSVRGHMQGIMSLQIIPSAQIILRYIRLFEQRTVNLYCASI